MKINYPELIGEKDIKLKFAIGDKVKHKEYDMEFVISGVNIKPDCGKHYMGVGIVDGEKDWAFGDEENLELVEANYYKKTKE